MSKNKIIILLGVVCAVFTLGGISHAQQTQLNLDQSIKLMHEIGVTRYDDKESFRAKDTIRRDEGAAMLYRFAKHHEIMNSRSQFDEVDCKFVDIGLAHEDLSTAIDEACIMGIFKGYKQYFYPTKNLKDSEVVAVAMRMFVGITSEKGEHRADEYYKLARSYNLIPAGSSLMDRTKFDEPATRGEVALFLSNVHSFFNRTGINKPTFDACTSAQTYENEPRYPGFVESLVSVGGSLGTSEYGAWESGEVSEVCYSENRNILLVNIPKLAVDLTYMVDGVEKKYDRPVNVFKYDISATQLRKAFLPDQQFSLWSKDGGAPINMHVWNEELNRYNLIGDELIIGKFGQKDGSYFTMQSGKNVGGCKESYIYRYYYLDNVIKLEQKCSGCEEELVCEDHLLVTVGN